MLLLLAGSDGCDLGNVEISEKRLAFELETVGHLESLRADGSGCAEDDERSQSRPSQE